MCGIIGVIGNKLPKQSTFEKARDVLAHRGPDDAGVLYDEELGVALGHRRLSIIDLSDAGRQPMFSSDGRYALVFNGEIYNYLEVRAELASAHDFKTKTDTEVLLAAYQVWGADCLQKLNGMFAFAIWDKQKKEFFCARDRIGIKPFYYAIRNKCFYFASEIKGLLALGIPAQPNEQVLFDYLYYSVHDHLDETFFGAIQKLPAGHFGVWKENKLSVTRYWDLSDQTSRESAAMSLEEAKERLGSLLTDSLRLRFRSDVPIGLNLSSGLDSNALLCFGEQVIKKSMHTFSRCFASEEYNECSIIKDALTDEQKKFWHTVTFTPDEARALAEPMNAIQDEPFSGIPTIGGMKPYQQARDAGAVVILEGQGVDEILAGYGYYLPEYEKDVHANTLGNTQPASDYSQDMTELAGHELVDEQFMKKYFRKLSFPCPFNSNLLNAQYRDIRYTKIPKVLRMNDHTSMAFGRELRVPFLDHRIVEFCFALPHNYKIRAGVQKFLLRELMAAYIPDALRAKPKKSFGAVQNEWMRRHYRDWVYTILDSDSFRSRPYWNQRALRERVERFFGGMGDNSFFIWQTINIEYWFRKFID